MKLIGFTFIATQDEFEKWQKDNPDYSVHTVAPHMREMAIRDDGNKYELGQDAKAVWGVFVTYSYKAA